MNENQNLMGQDAVDKIRELATETKTCMFCTELNEVPFQTRPMSTRDVDDHGNLWFLSNATSDKNQDIKHDAEVQLIYSDNSNYNYLSVYGTAVVYTDRQKVEEYWSPIAKAWFKEGVDDPNATVICVKPKEGYYWDTKDGKIVSMVKMIYGAATGKSVLDSVQGSLEVG